MAKRPTSVMRDSERLAGLIFFVVYLLVMPLLFGKIILLTAYSKQQTSSQQT